MEKHAENVHQKLFPDPFLILLNNPKQPSHARNSFEKENFFFKTQSLLMEKIIKNKISPVISRF